MKVRPHTVMSSPAPKEQKKLVVAKREALSTSWAPRRRLMMDPAPWPNMKPKAWMMAMRPNTMPTAPEALMPTRPTNQVSAML